MSKDEFIIGKFEDLVKINPFQEVVQKRGNLIQTKNLKKLCDSSQYFLHGVDYLRGCSPSFELARELRKLPIFDIDNTTNSSEITIEGYCPYYLDTRREGTLNQSHYVPFGKITVQKFRDTGSREKYIISVAYEDLSVPVIEINFYYGDNNSKIAQNGIYCMIEFKGKPFRLQVATCGAFNPFEFLKCVLLSGFPESNSKSNGLYYNAYKYNYNQIFSNPNLTLEIILRSFKITRIDYRFDFFLPKGHFGLKDTEVFKNLRSSNANYTSSVYERKLANCPYGVKTKQGRHYTGRKNANSNRYVQTRFYQKQVDTRLKGWSELYSEYMNFNGEVWRLEFQFESKFCNARTDIGERYNFYDEFVDKKLTNQVFEFVGINEKKGSFCQRYEPPTLSLNKQTYSAQRRIFTRYMSDSRKLVDNGINPNDLINMALNNEQKEKIKRLNSREKIGNAFAIDSPFFNSDNEENCENGV